MLTENRTKAEPKQIVLSFNGTSGTVLYTVPSGKTCKGTLFGGSAIVGGATVAIASGGAAPIELIAGTILKAYGTTNYGYFVGVEQ